MPSSSARSGEFKASQQQKLPTTCGDDKSPQSPHRHTVLSRILLSVSRTPNRRRHGVLSSSTNREMPFNAASNSSSARVLSQRTSTKAVTIPSRLTASCSNDNHATQIGQAPCCEK